MPSNRSLRPLGPSGPAPCRAPWILTLTLGFLMLSPGRAAAGWRALDREAQETARSGDLREAYQIHRHALDAHDATGARRGITYARLGRILERLEDPRRAGLAYQRARDILFLALGPGDRRVRALDARIRRLAVAPDPAPSVWEPARHDDPEIFPSPSPEARLEAAQARQARGDLWGAYHEIRALAESGLAPAKVALGAMLHQGQPVPRDDVKALALFEEAAREGQVLAQRYAGLMTLGGQGTTADPARARGWFQAAALQDDPVALRHLGVMQLTGQGGLAPDSAAARPLLERAADQGDVDAHYNLAVLHEEGRGQAPRPDRAAHHYRLAALGGHPAAQTNLGLMYVHGRGVPQDLARARSWFERAAAQGYPKASYALSVMEAEGLLARAPSADDVQTRPGDRG